MTTRLTAWRAQPVYMVKTNRYYMVKWGQFINWETTKHPKEWESTSCNCMPWIPKVLQKMAPFSTVSGLSSPGSHATNLPVATWF